MRTSINALFLLMSPALLLSCGEQNLDFTSAAHSAQWKHHGGDHSSSKYAPFDQINAGNFEQLEVAWRWESADLRLPEDQIFPSIIKIFAGLGDGIETPLEFTSTGIISTDMSGRTAVVHTVVVDF